MAWGAMIKGFSLVELSIVLVILGLLTGGILSGQALIRAAELRSVSTELPRHHAALMTFRDKYQSLPGDTLNATRFWGSINTGGTNGNCSAPAADQGSGTQTCNGNGDGRIGLCGSDCYERFRAYQHMASAGLVEGTYSGVTGPAGNKHSIIGENVPASKLSTAGWTLFYMGPRDHTHPSWFANDYGHAYFFGAQHYLHESMGSVLRPEEAWNIDTKLDDGRPTTGFIMERKGNTTSETGEPLNCTTNASAVTSEYNVSRNAIACMLIVKSGF